MGDMEPMQYVGIGLGVAGLVALLAIYTAARMAFRTVKLVAALAVIAAGVLFYVNGGADEVQSRIDERRSNFQG